MYEFIERDGWPYLVQICQIRFVFARLMSKQTLYRCASVVQRQWYRIPNWPKGHKRFATFCSNMHTFFDVLVTSRQRSLQVTNEMNGEMMYRGILFKT